MKILIVALIMVGALGAVAGDGKPAKHEGFSDVERWVERFEGPDRDKWQKPITLLTFLGLSSGDRVADIGAGTGYMTSMLSITVDNIGKVYAVDIEPRMLEYIEQRTDISIPNVETILAEPDDPRLPDGELELVLVINTWHHIRKRGAYIKRIRPALKPSGRVAIVDFHAGELPVGPPPGEKLSREKVIREFEKAGWRLASESTALPYQYVLIFYPPAAGPA